jgi:hypothetical protein
MTKAQSMAQAATVPAAAMQSAPMPAAAAQAAAKAAAAAEAAGEASVSREAGDHRVDLPSGVFGQAATQRHVDPRPVLAWIMGAIALWGAVLAGGVVLYDYRAGAMNSWKPVTIVVCVAGFLGLFRWTMARSARRANTAFETADGDST